MPDKPTGQQPTYVYIPAPAAPEPAPARPWNGRFTLLTISGLVTVTLIGVVAVVVLIPDTTQALMFATVIVGVSAATISSLAAGMRATEAADKAAEIKRTAEHTSNQLGKLQIQIDGHMTELLKQTAANAEAIGRAAGLIQGREKGLAEANALQLAKAETPPAAQAQAQAEAVADAVVARLQEPGPEANT